MIDAARIIAVRLESRIGRLGHALADAGKTAEDIERVAAEVERWAVGYPASPQSLGDTLALIVARPTSRPSVDAMAKALLDEARKVVLHAPRPLNRHERRAQRSRKWRG